MFGQKTQKKKNRKNNARVNYTLSKLMMKIIANLSYFSKYEKQVLQFFVMTARFMDNIFNRPAFKYYYNKLRRYLVKGTERLVKAQLKLFNMITNHSQ